MLGSTVYALIATIEFECEDLLGVYSSEEDAREAFKNHQEQALENEDKVRYQDYYLRELII